LAATDCTTRRRALIQMGTFTGFPPDSSAGLAAALFLLFHGQQPLQRSRQVVAIFGRRWNGHPVVLPLLHRKPPALVFQRLGAQRLETVQAHHHELTFFDRQAVTRLAMLFQERKILDRKGPDAFAVRGNAANVADVIVRVVHSRLRLQRLAGRRIFVLFPLRMDHVVAEGADQGGSVFSQRFRPRAAFVVQNVRKVRIPGA